MSSPYLSELLYTGRQLDILFNMHMHVHDDLLYHISSVKDSDRSEVLKKITSVMYDNMKLIVSYKDDLKRIHDIEFTSSQDRIHIDNLKTKVEKMFNDSIYFHESGDSIKIDYIANLFLGNLYERDEEFRACVFLIPDIVFVYEPSLNDVGLVSEGFAKYLKYSSLFRTDEYRGYYFISTSF